MKSTKTIIQFRGANFHEWATDAKLVLMLKGLKYVTSESFQLSKLDQTERAQAIADNEKASAMLMLSIDPAFRQSSWDPDTVQASEILLDMQKRYGPSNDKLGQLNADRAELGTIFFHSHAQLPEIIRKLDELGTRTEGTKAPILPFEKCMQLLRLNPPEWDNFLSSLRANNKATLNDWETLRTALTDEWQHRETQRQLQDNLRTSLLLGTKSTTKPEKQHCENCERAGRTRIMGSHNISSCWHPGGKREGQRPSQRTNRNRDDSRNKNRNNDRDNRDDRNDRNSSTASQNGPRTYVLSASHSRTQQPFVLDSGASYSCTSDASMLTDIQQLASPAFIYTADGTQIVATQKGTVTFDLGNNDLMKIRDVHHFADIDRNLLSIATFTRAGLTVNFNDGQALILDNGTTIATGTFGSNNIYEADFHVQYPATVPGQALALSASASTSTDINMWHRRMGHVSARALRKLPEATTDAKVDTHDDLDFCDACSLGKMTARPYRKSSSPPFVADKELGELAIDLAGPIRTPTPKGHRYHLPVSGTTSEMFRNCYLNIVLFCSELLSKPCSVLNFCNCFEMLFCRLLFSLSLWTNNFILFLYLASLEYRQTTSYMCAELQALYVKLGDNEKNENRRWTDFASWAQQQLHEHKKQQPQPQVQQQVKQVKEHQEKMWLAYRSNPRKTQWT
jgi:hypothetical protein